MINPMDIKERMEVVGSDGRHVGRVDHVVADEIELAKFDLGGGMKHHMIPISWVDHVDGHKVCLNLTEKAAKNAWREKRGHLTRDDPTGPATFI